MSWISVGSLVDNVLTTGGNPPRLTTSLKICRQCSAGAGSQAGCRFLSRGPRSQEATMSDSRGLIAVATFLMVFMFNAAPSRAQVETPSSEVVDRFLVLVPLRDLESIQVDKELAERARAAALEVERAAVEQRGEARARISA